MTEAAVQTDRVARLWLATMQEVVRRSAHDVKNALNGVAVNLEVVRGRLGRPDATADGAVRFARTASSEFERVSEYVEALLALTRSAREPTDVAALVRDLRPLLRLAGDASAASGAPGAPEPGTSVSAADAQASRLALAAAALAAAGKDTPAHCRIDVDDRGAVRVRITGAVGAPTLPPEIGEVAAEAGIGLDRETDGLTLTFPPLEDDERRAPRASRYA